MGRKKSNRPDGRVNISFRYEGKVYSVTAPTREEAILKKQERLEQLKSDTEDRINPTVNSYYENVFTPNRRDKVQESTLRSQGCQFRDAAAVPIKGTGRSFGELQMQDVKARDVQAVQKALRESGRTTETVNNIIAHVSHVFNRAVLDRTITWNPCVTVDRLQRTEPKCKDTKHRALTEEETSVFFSAMADSYYENCCRLMIQTGMRVGEVAALSLSDFDTKEGVIHITKTVARREDGCYYISPTPKTDCSFRDIPLTDTVMKIFKNQMQQNELVFGDIGFNRPVFASFEGGLLREYSLNREIKRKCQAVGIDLFTTHAFRATFATRFIEQRPQDYKILSEVLGHADIKITLNLYAAHKSKGKQIEAMNDIIIAM